MTPEYFSKKKKKGRTIILEEGIACVKAHTSR